MATKHEITIPYVGPAGNDLLLWRNPKKTGAVFAVISGAFLFLKLSPVTPVVLLLTLVSYVSLALFLWAQVGAVLKKGGPPVPAVFKSGVSEDDIRSLAEKVRDPVNKALANIAVLVSGTDMKLSLVVVASTWIGAWLFKRVPMLTLAYALFFLALTVPKGYELKKDDVDAALKVAKARADEAAAKVHEQVLSKLPKSKKA